MSDPIASRQTLAAAITRQENSSALPFGNVCAGNLLRLGASRLHEFSHRQPLDVVFQSVCHGFIKADLFASCEDRSQHV